MNVTEKNFWYPLTERNRPKVGFVERVKEG